MNNNFKKFDIVILTHKPKHFFIDSLLKINNQVFQPNKIIIYNTDEKSFYDNFNINEFNNAISKLKMECEIYHIPFNEFDHGKTRNDAATKSNTPYIMYMTDDAVPYDEYLTKNLFLSFCDEKVAVAYARQVARENSKIKEKYIREYNYGDVDIIKDINTEKKYGIKNYFCSNVCSMYNRSIFDLVGKFDENIILNEDTFYAFRAIKLGYKVLYKSDAKVIHSHDYTYIEQYKRNFDIGVSHADKIDYFNKFPAENEGKKLFINILKKLIFQFRIIDLFDFVIDCFYRYFGYKDGKNYNKFDYNICLKKTSNMQYFYKKNLK